MDHGEDRRVHPDPERDHQERGRRVTRVLQEGAESASHLGKRPCPAVPGGARRGRRGAAALHSVRYNERSQPEVLERRSPTGIARQRETRPNNPAPRQSPTNPRIANRAESRRHGALASSPGGGLRPASRGSAKPAPTTPPPANLTPTNPRIPTAQNHVMERRSPTGIARQRETRTNDPAPRQSGRKFSHGLERRSPTGIARERETCTDDAALRQSHGGAPVSDRHRAGARNLHRRPASLAAGLRPPITTATPIPRSAGLRPASRGSAKPAPTTLRHANLTAWSAGLRPAPLREAQRKPPKPKPP